MLCLLRFFFIALRWALNVLDSPFPVILTFELAEVKNKQTYILMYVFLGICKYFSVILLCNKNQKSHPI